LELEDDELIGVLIGKLDLESGELKLLVENIRAFAVARM
jgi:hypothetical protein